MSPLTTRRVWAKLWNAEHSYDVQLNLEVRESWGQNSVPDEWAVTRITLLGGIVVEEGNYSLKYTLNGREDTTGVSVEDGQLLSDEGA
jgi:hypothetical protein